MRKTLSEEDKPKPNEAVGVVRVTSVTPVACSRSKQGSRGCTGVVTHCQATLGGRWAVGRGPCGAAHVDRPVGLQPELQHWGKTVDFGTLELAG